MTKVAGWTGFATFILAGLGILNTKREKHYFSILLLVDLAACTSCLISAMVSLSLALALFCLYRLTYAIQCLTVLFITYWWINKGLWITGVTLAWTCFFLSLALLVRTTLIRRRIRGAVEIPIAVARGRTRESARGSARGSARESTRESTREIDMWRQDVTPEEGPLIPNYAPSQFSFDPYADDETEHASSRSSSPVSTVAHWTTVSGTNTLITQYTEPPPLYSRFER